MSKSNKKILFQLTGSIAAYKACSLISQLIKNGHEVQTVASPSLFQFVGGATLEGLTGKPVFSDMYQAGRAMDHIQLARESDLILLCPATANSINKLAAGISDDLIGALFLANNFKTPYWIAPAMNAEMFKHPATQASLGRLREWGARVIEPGTGLLACGEEGPGRLVEPDDLLIEIERFFTGGKP